MRETGRRYHNEVRREQRFVRQGSAMIRLLFLDLSRVENVATQVRISGGLVVVMEIEKWPEGRCILKGELTEFADRCKT